MNRQERIRFLGDVASVGAALGPDDTAIVYGPRRLTFADLDERSNRFANGLRAEGISSQSRIAMLDRNSECYFDVMFGAPKANVVLVTINFRLTRPEISYILSDSNAEMLFVGKEFAAIATQLAGELPALKKIVVVDGQGDTGYEHWLASQAATPVEGVAIRPNDAAVQMYTSGTTGNPKGVELSHSAMTNAARVGLEVWPFLYESASAVLGTMPLFHIAAFNLCIAALCAGARAEIVRDATPEELADIIPDHGISLVPLPAAVIHALLRMESTRTKDFGSLKVMLIAGSGIAVELLREAGETFDCGFALSYGSTEMCGGISYLGPGECTPDAGKRLQSAGRLLPHSEVRIVDARGGELPVGEVGEIMVRSNRLMTCYWNRPEATAEALRDGWFHSGDAGYLDEGGYLYITDRIKDMVLSGGENVYPAEVEKAMFAHPAVEDVAVIGVPDEKWGESLLAFVVLKRGVQAPTTGEFIEFLRGNLAGFKIPRRYEFVDAFPRNAMGKVLKRTLREPFWQGRGKD